MQSYQLAPLVEDVITGLEFPVDLPMWSLVGQQDERNKTLYEIWTCHSLWSYSKSLHLLNCRNLHWRKIWTAISVSSTIVRPRKRTKNLTVKYVAKCSSTRRIKMSTKIPTKAGRSTNVSVAGLTVRIKRWSYTRGPLMQWKRLNTRVRFVRETHFVL